MAAQSIKPGIVPGSSGKGTYSPLIQSFGKNGDPGSDQMD
jgi:hypothetical protein